MVDLFNTCSASLSGFIAVLFCAIVIVLPTLTLSWVFHKAWILGLVLVPFVYPIAVEFAAFAFFALTILTLGLPLIFCTAFTH